MGGWRSWRILSKMFTRIISILSCWGVSLAPIWLTTHLEVSCREFRHYPTISMNILARRPFAWNNSFFRSRGWGFKMNGSTQKFKSNLKKLAFWRHILTSFRRCRISLFCLGLVIERIMKFGWFRIRCSAFKPVQKLMSNLLKNWL